MIGFIIWSLIALLIAGIGIISWRSKKAVGFFTGAKAPEVKDVKKYNHAVAVLWWVYALLLEALGIPLLFLKQNSAGFILPVFGVVAITIALAVTYTFILSKHSK
ncbi:MAG: hypothetical protein IJM76_01885 [Lachnospiraceae bacterium]|nr:hypothetical protein [Lachnospiraceae bacterium]